MNKRKKLDNLKCLFCKENESVQHLFFDCCVSKRIWADLNETLGWNMEATFESVATKWVCNRKFINRNMITSVVLWGIWKLINNLCFRTLLGKM